MVKMLIRLNAWETLNFKETLRSVHAHLRIDLKYFSNDVFLIVCVLQNDREDGNSKLTEHFKGGQEVVDRFNVLKQ